MAIFLQKSPKRGLWLGGDYFFSLFVDFLGNLLSSHGRLYVFFAKNVIEVWKIAIAEKDPTPIISATFSMFVKDDFEVGAHFTFFCKGP